MLSSILLISTKTRSDKTLRNSKVSATRDVFFQPRLKRAGKGVLSFPLGLILSSFRSFQSCC